MVLTVQLENNVWTFFPGQTIAGNVVVTKNIWHKVEGLSIRFLGKMEFGCAASAPVVPPQDTLPSSHQQESLFERLTRSRPVQEIVLDHKMNLLHSWKVLKPGSHEFPFTYQLPDDTNLPESIKIDGFRILYEFVVVLRRPRDDYKVYQTPFTVRNVLEADTLTTDAMRSHANSFEKKTEDKIGFCMCCQSGPYGILFKVPKRLGTMGEDVDFILEIWNNTRLDMDSAKIRLVRQFKNKKGLETRKKETVSEFCGPRVASGEHDIWASYFRIPANTPPTNFVRREAYEINYFLKALVHPLNQSSKKVSIKCPILVLRGPDSHAHADNSTIQDTVPESEPEVGPPPTYEQAMGFETNSATVLIE